MFYCVPAMIRDTWLVDQLAFNVATTYVLQMKLVLKDLKIVVILDHLGYNSQTFNFLR